MEQVHRVREQLNLEIDATSGKALLDHVRGHRYASEFSQRLAAKAVTKTAASGAAAGSH